MGRIKGISVNLHIKSKVGIDAFNKPIYKDTLEAVENVLVAPAGTDDIVNSTELDGKKSIYILCIPKGDEHDWVDTKVEFFGHTWKTIGFPEEYIEELLPLDWNKKVKVERYG